MQLSDEQRADIERRIAEYEAQRDQHLANANAANGAAMALRELLAAGREE
jgi:hypothetical protein